jgi:hypothetical protein
LPQTAIFGPVYATVLLTFAVWVYMYALRIPFILNSGLTPEQLAEPGKLAAMSPAAVSNPSDNFKNLFEIPVLFYALATILFVTGQVDATYVWAGWVFFAFRVLHSLMHCTRNVVIVRFYLYLISTLAVAFMAGRAMLAHFGS